VNSSWKDRLYEAYVSSGQARGGTQLTAPRTNPYITAIIRKHLPTNRGTEIVDLGCGHGTFVHLLKQAGYTRVRGVDVSAEQVDLAHQWGITEVEQSDILTFLAEQPPDSTDVILCMDVLEHLERQETFDILDHIYRVLRPGGQLLAHVPNAEGLFGMRVRYGDFTHEVSFTPRSIASVLTTVGFQRIWCLEDKPIPHSVMSMIRRVIWEIGTLPFRVLLAAETGRRSFILSQNMLVGARRPDSDR